MATRLAALRATFSIYLLAVITAFGCYGGSLTASQVDSRAGLGAGDAAEDKPQGTDDAFLLADRNSSDRSISDGSTVIGVGGASGSAGAIGTGPGGTMATGGAVETGGIATTGGIMASGGGAGGASSSAGAIGTDSGGTKATQRSRSGNSTSATISPS